MPGILRTTAQFEHFLAERSLSLEDCQLAYLRHWPTFPLRIPVYYAQLIDWFDEHDPLRLMSVPQEAELRRHPTELSDPIGDGAHEVVPGLIHRYPDRCLLLLTTYCHIHCRFCFRREVVGQARPTDFTAIQVYLHQHQEVRELIFSGGDPFTYPVEFFRSLRRHLEPIAQVMTWRWHTRIPATDPESITPEWLAAFQEVSKQKVVVLHVNHPREVTPQMVKLVKSLQRAGALLLSQTVLLKGVNDSVATLEELFRGLVEVGVKPYYLHHLDLAPGTTHFRLSIEQGKQLFSRLRGRLTGIGMPEYMLDLPGGRGKVPVMWLQPIDTATYETTAFTGQIVRYQDPAA